MVRIIAENLNTKEKFEAEITFLKDKDLERFETFYFPENKNPERAVRNLIENQDISADKKSQIWENLKGIAQAVLQVGKHVLLLGRKIFDFILHLVSSYPKLSIGLAIGAVIGSLIAAIPIIGWIIGGLAKLLFPLIGGYLGLKEDLKDKRRVFKVIGDESVEKEIEREVKVYDPINTPVNTSAQDTLKGGGVQFKSGLDSGISRGATAMKTMLFASTESKFDKITADDLGKLLVNINDLEFLSSVNQILLECTSSNEFIQKVSESIS